MGHIAASAAGNLHFCEHFLSALEDYNLKHRVNFGSIQCRKKSCGTATYYYNIGLPQATILFSAKCSQSAMVSLISSCVVRGFIKYILKTTWPLRTVVTSNACFELTIFWEICWFSASNFFSESLLPIGLYRKLITAKVAGEITSQLGLFR